MRRNLLAPAFAAAFFVLGNTSTAAAQVPPELLTFSTWNLSFTYSAESSLAMDGQTFDYAVTVSGRAVLQRDEMATTDGSFRGEPNLTVSLSYSGSALDPEGCGLVESLNQTTIESCDYPTTLFFDDGGFDLDLGCSRVGVSHVFEWQGTCGELFPYPEQPITDWAWGADDFVQDGSAMRTTFDYPSSGVALSGSDAGEPVAFLAPLFTAIASGTGTPLTYSFDFEITPGEAQELVLDIESPAYESWRPSAGTSGTPGEALPMTATLKTASGEAPLTTVTGFEWRLEGTSSEPGIAMNYPVDASDRELDMRFEGTSADSHAISADGQTAERFQPEGPTDTVQVVPYDWGGWSSLSVTAILSDGRRITGRLPGSAEDGARLPKRAAESFIADRWKSDRGASAADSADDDPAPAGDGTLGDGLTLYQEYRGFYEGGSHSEGDPGVKDLFVNNRARAAAAAGVARFSRLSGLNMHPWLTTAELPASRVINGNHAEGPWLVDQHALVIETIPGQVGFAEARGGPGNPKMISLVALMGNWSSLSQSYLSSIVAHELFHGINAYHHGETDIVVTWRKNADGVLVEVVSGGAYEGTPIRVLREDGTDITDAVLAEISQEPNQAMKLNIGVDNGQHSGFDNCVMRYNNSFAYVSKFDSAARYAVSELMGQGLCKSAVGAGPNASDWDPQSRYSDAAPNRGNCAGQLLVTDAVDAPPR